MQVQFLGAAGTVTGSKYLIETTHHKVMVDCGLFQGVKDLREKNWTPMPVSPSDVDLVLLTHAHMDHCGYLPKFVKDGYRGPILGTPPSVDIAEIVLKDAAKILQEEAELANQEGFSKHSPALPLYNDKDVQATLPKLRSCVKDQWHEVLPGFRVRWHYNGHILGACWLEVKTEGRHLVFSGDIGRPGDPLLFDPELPENADYLWVESTYGGRHHPNRNILNDLETSIAKTISRGGSYFLPCFAIERTQLLMYLLWQLKSQNRLPHVPIYLDSPMGERVYNLFEEYPEWHKLSVSECKALGDMVHIITQVNETKKMAKRQEPKIVIAGSGMLTGGRILNYLIYELNNPKSTIALTGFQAQGTRGRDLIEKAPSLKIQGQNYAVKAEVIKLNNLSAHGDQSEILHWTGQFKTPPKTTFVVHGEPEAAQAMSEAISQQGWVTRVPGLGEIVPLP